MKIYSFKSHSWLYTRKTKNIRSKYYKFTNLLLIKVKIRSNGLTLFGDAVLCGSCAKTSLIQSP